MNSHPAPSLVVAHLGARRHYAIPLAFHRAGLLRQFYTDLWVGQGISGRTVRALARALGVNGLRQWAGRYDPRLPDAKVTAFTRFGLEFVWRFRRARSVTDQTRVVLWAGEAFGQLVARNGLDGVSIVHGVHGHAHRLFEAAHGRGLRTLLDQMSCPQLYRRLEREEQERWPAWEVNPGSDALAASADERERAELDLADAVLCPSAFVEDYVRSLGVPADKCRRVAYGIDVPNRQSAGRPYRGDRPLRVLYAGGVRLMKGVSYLLEALRALDSNQIEAKLAGPVLLTERAQAQMRGYCQLLGMIPRNAMRELYEWCDVFVQPSLCEGSSLATYEALVAGKPVIATTNAGSPLRDGEDGFVVPIRDAAALAECLDNLAGRPDLLDAMQEQARQRRADLSLHAYAGRLVNVATESRPQRAADLAATGVSQ